MDTMKITTEFVNSSLNLYLTYIFFSCFYFKKHNKMFSLIIFVTADLIFTLSLLFLKGSLLLYIPMMITAVMLASLYECKLFHKIIYSLIILGIMGSVEMLVGISITAIFSISVAAAKEGVMYIAGMLLSKFIVFLIILFIRLKKHQSLVKQFGKNYLGIMLFPLSTLVVLIIQHWIFMNIPSPTKTVYYAALFGYALLLLANIIVFDFIDSLYINIYNESKLEAANQIIITQTNQYKELIVHNKNIAKIQHDNKHFYSALINEMKKGNYTKVENKLKEKCELYDNRIITGENIFLTIIKIKKSEAMEKGIVIEYDINNVATINIEPTDSAILLGNALDNAIEECQRINDSQQKQIDVSISMKNNLIVIIVKNPTSENIKTSSLATKKADTKNHGFGIISMKQIAAKYGGDVVFNCENDIFAVSIIINNPVSLND